LAARSGDGRDRRPRIAYIRDGDRQLHARGNAQASGIEGKGPHRRVGVSRRVIAKAGDPPLALRVCNHARISRFIDIHHQIRVRTRGGVAARAGQPGGRGPADHRSNCQCVIGVINEIAGPPNLASGRFLQGCIRLRLAGAGTGGREVFPLLSDGQSNPEGWQKVAGGSFQGCRGNDHRFTRDNTVASWMGCQKRADTGKASYFQARPRTSQPGLWHPFWVRDQDRVYPVVGPFTLTDHRLPAPNPPGWIVKARSEPSPVARISRAGCSPAFLVCRTSECRNCRGLHHY